jgi:serine/threonine protein kinase/TolB-like protein/Tfp pilus assembly protein PilF
MKKELSANTELSHYRIISKIGAGGMGEVYLAQDTKLDRKVALKILPADLAANQDRMRRFVQEAKAAAALNHPNIAHIYEIGESDGTNFIAMEFVDGNTLREKIYGEKNALKLVIKHLLQVAEGLAKAHASGIVHRDLKPDNIMITRDGHAKVLDFGLAKLVETSGPGLGQSEGGEAPTAVMQQHSVPGMIMGTVGYMSPEQAQAKPVDQRSDIFSFGCLLYEAATGRKPFAGDSIVDTLHKIIYEPAPAITDLNPSASPGLQRVIRKCLAKEPEKRYQTIRDTANDLEELLEEMTGVSDIERSVTPSTNTTTSSTGSTGDDVRPESTASVTYPSASSAEYIVSGVKQHKLAAALVVLVLIGGVGLALYLRAQTTQVAIESIAVMPFVNESGNADVEYLSDGMTETLISSLSQLANLNVRPRSSVFRYKGKETDPQTIGKELNVQAILNGKLVQRGQDLSLFVELIDGALNKVVWSQRYDRKQTDIVTLQTDVARDVSNRLKSKLSGADEAKVTRTYTHNPEAYQLYLKGNFYRTKYTEEGSQKGIEYYQKALEIDPNYALAYHGIAQAYDFANDWYLSPKEAEPKAKAAALKALELDETLAETHFLLGKIVFWYDWDWPAAEREWQRANELDPTYPAYYPVYLAAMGRFDEAIKAQESVLSRLPLDLNMNMDSAGILLSAGQTDKSIEQTRKALDLDANFWWAYQNLGLAYARKKQYAEAIVALEKACSVDNSPSNLGYLGAVYGIAGKDADAKRVLRELKEISKRRYVSPYNLAVVYAGLNDKDQAFEWLDRAYEARSFGMTQLKVETVLDNLRSEPRFKDLLKRMNLPE